MNNSTVSVIVPCRNEKDDIETCVRSILAQVPPPEGFEVIVADGMSDDGTRDILNRLAHEDSRLRVVDNPHRIIPTGLNLAIHVAQGRIIIRMDAHTRYAPDYLLQCLAVLHETGADNVGGPARTESIGYIQSAISAAYHSPFAVGGSRFHNTGYEGHVDTVTYGCWRREIFDRIGLFDEELVVNEDDEFNLRLLRAGGKIWQSPRIKSWYRPRQSLGTLFRQYMQYGYWKVRILQKHKKPASVRHLIPGCFLFLLVLLPLLYLWWPLAGWGWLGLVGMYSLCITLASLINARGRRWTLLPVLPLVFACYHLAYGYGFLRGMWDFVILRRGPSRVYTELTRPSTREASSSKTATF